MTRTISLIGIAVTALVVAVPTALGEGRLAGSQELAITSAKQLPALPIASENVVRESPELRADRLRGEGLNRRYGLGEFSPNTVMTYKDAGERVVVPQSVKAEQARSEGLNKMYGLGDFAPTIGYKDSAERADVPTSPVVVDATSTGDGIEWPQIGIGFGVGIALALGLGIALRSTRHRQLAH